MTHLYSRRALLKEGGRVGLFLLVGGSVAAACTQAAASPSPSQSAVGGHTLDRIKRDKVIRVGFANEAPFAYKEGDKLTGYQVTLQQTVFKDLGVERLDGVLTEFSAMIPALQSGRIDVISGDMYITPVRCGQILFANPEHTSTESFAVKKGNPLNLRSLADVAKNKKAKIAILLGSQEVEMADTAGIAKDQQVILPDYPTELSALQAGQVDVMVAVTISLRDLLKRTNDPNLEQVYLSEQPRDKDGQEIISYASSGFRKEDADLRDLYNAGLAKLRASGQQLQIMSEFGLGEQDLAPADLTAAQICAG